MNVLFLIRRFDFGGAENYARELANSLAEGGDKVFLFSKNGRQRRLLSPHVLFRPANFTKRLLLFSLVRLFIFVKWHKIDVIHAHQPSAILTACWLGKLARLPVVVTVHSTTALELTSDLTRNTPARIIYISRHTMERSDWYPSLRPRCRYIPNGIKPREWQAHGDEQRLVYCSRIDKSHARLLQLLIEEVVPRLKVKFPSLKLEIVGDGDLFRQVEMWAKKTNSLLGAETIVPTGFQERFVTQGSLVIGVGRVALEALSAEIPVLSVNSRRCGPRISPANYALFSENNFVDVTAQPPTVGSLLESIESILANYHAAQSESRLLREKVHVELTLANMSEKIRLEYLEAARELQSQAARRRLTEARPAAVHLAENI